MINSVVVRVPGTTANLGAGFDCLGTALTLYNLFHLTPLESGNPSQTVVEGLGSDRIPKGANNLVYQTCCQYYEHLQKEMPPVRLEIEINVPPARGLGSSATAIVGGLLAANALAGDLLSLSELAALATRIEGHPDNVVPALLGGCRLAASGYDRDWEICDLVWHPDIVPIVAIPDFELSTTEARRVLPEQYSRGDAVFNAAHLGLLIRGLETGKADWLRSALQDRIHQPYRQALIPGYAALQTAAITAGAYGLVISGAGPTLLALAPVAQAETVRSAMADAWTQIGIGAQVQICAIDYQGATVESR